jgi:spore germination protein YaaH
MKTSLYILGGILSILAIYVTFFSPSAELFNPLCTSSATAPEKCLQTQSSLGDHSLPSNSYVVLGFAPYWNIKKLTPESLSSITHFAYFNLHLNGDGSLYTKVNRREEDPGYTNYKRLLSGALSRGDKPLIITYMPESQSALTQIVTSTNNRRNAIDTIVESLNESGAAGVNIDFEPLGDTPESTRNSFTLFIQELHQKLLTPNSSNLVPLLTISTYASAASRQRLWDLTNLEAYTDYFVIMTYDYTMPGSDTAGPNAPMRGSGDIFEHDIVKNIAEISKLVPSRKILLGIPFYGYEWDTVDASKYSPTQAQGSVASLERIQKMLDERTLVLVWDRSSLTPYGVASESGKTSQIYFENETSIRLKLEFVRSANLGGIAIWALGYEGNTPWLWPTISTLNR